MPSEEHLHRLAGHHSERRQIANGIASDEGAECLSDGKAPVRRPTFATATAGRHAQTPSARADEKARAGESKNGNESPADLTDAVEDFGDARAAHGVAEQHQTAQRRQ